MEEQRKSWEPMLLVIRLTAYGRMPGLTDSPVFSSLENTS